MNEVAFKYNNGDILRDKVTGLQGVVMVCAAYSTGCHHYGLQPREVKDNKTPDWTWLDESALELVASGAVSFTKAEGRSSGPMPSGPEG